MKFKNIIVLSILTAMLFGFAPVAQAATVAELQAQITQLLAQIQQLQTQIDAQQGQEPVFCYDFTKNLGFSDSGTPAVRALHTALEKEGFSVGSDKATGVYTEQTSSGVVGFQQKYRAEVLAPFDLQFGTGFTGRTTRAKLNALYGCSVVAPISNPGPIPFPGPPPTLEPIITLLSPNGGEQWVRGGTYDITWSYSGSVDKLIQIELGLPASDGPEIVSNISANAQRYSWQVPLDFPVRSDYRIIVRGILPAYTLLDRSDNYFSIVEATTTTPSITVLSPNGGEKWVEGETHSITWKATGVDRVNISAASGGKDKGHIAFNLDAKIGKHSWRVPAGFITGFGVSRSDAMKVRIYAAEDPSVYDVNDNNFSIVSATTTTPSITVLSPNGGENILEGSSHVIQWNSVGVDKVGISLVDYSENSNGLALWVTQVPASQGSYTWTAGNTAFPSQTKIPGARFKILVNAPNVLDHSDNFFSISKTASRSSVDLVIGKSATGPLVVQKGSTPTLSWSGNDINSCTASLGGSYDLNADGVVNINDLTLYTSKNPGVSADDAMLKNIQAAFGTTGWSYDLNGDGVVNIHDLTLFSAYNPGVSNAFLSGMQQAVGTLWGSYDLNGDGGVNINDITLFTARNPGVNNEFLTALTGAFGTSIPNTWKGNKALSGIEQTVPLSTGRTYVLTCTGTGGTVSDSVSVIVQKTASTSLENVQDGLASVEESASRLIQQIQEFLQR